MKLKENFVLRQVADTWVVLPVAEATLDFNGMLTLNETGAVLWRALEQGGSEGTEPEQGGAAPAEALEQGGSATEPATALERGDHAATPEQGDNATVPVAALVKALAEALTAEYDVTADQAAADVEEFLVKLAEAGCLEQ